MGWQRGSAAWVCGVADGVGRQHGGELAVVRGSWERAERERERARERGESWEF